MIKYVLENNVLTKKDPNDRYARVVEVRSRTEEDIAEAKELSEAIKKTPLQHTEPVSPLRIEFVYDQQSSTTNDKVTRGGTVKITGHNLKIAGEDPAVGVEFISMEDPEANYKVPSKNILINNPSELMIIAPMMVVNEKVKVKVATQYTTGALLKKPRAYTFDRELTVVDPENG
jgi:hypothetical protein